MQQKEVQDGEKTRRKVAIEWSPNPTKRMIFLPYLKAQNHFQSAHSQKVELDLHHDVGGVGSGHRDPVPGGQRVRQECTLERSAIHCRTHTLFTHTHIYSHTLTLWAV